MFELSPLSFTVERSSISDEKIGKLNLMILKGIGALYHAYCKKELTKTWQVGKSFSKMPTITNYDAINLTLENTDIIDDLSEDDKIKVIKLVKVFTLMKDDIETLVEKVKKASDKFNKLNKEQPVEFNCSDYNNLLINLINNKMLSSWDNLDGLEEELKTLVKTVRIKLSDFSVYALDESFNGLATKLVELNNKETEEINRKKGLELAKKRTKLKEETTKKVRKVEKENIEVDNNGHARGYISDIVIDRFIMSRNFGINDSIGDKNISLIQEVFRVARQEIELRMEVRWGEFVKGRLTPAEIKGYCCVSLTSILAKSLGVNNSTKAKLKISRLIAMFNNYDNMKTLGEDFEDAKGKICGTVTVSFFELPELILIMKELLNFDYETSPDNYNDFRVEVFELMKVSRFEIGKCASSKSSSTLDKLKEDMQTAIILEQNAIKDRYRKNSNIGVLTEGINFSNTADRKALEETIKQMNLQLKS